MSRHLEEAWTQAIRPTLADYCGKAWFLSTPKGNNTFKTLFDQAAETPDWARWQMPTSSNPFIAVDEIAAMQRELPSVVFQQEVLAEFVDWAGGLVKREHLVHGVEPSHLHLPVVLGVDLAISEKQGADYTAIAGISRDPETGVVYVREVERHRCGFNAVLNAIKAAAARWNPALIAIEQTQYQVAVIQELTRTTRLPIRGVVPDRDKLTRFLPLLTRYSPATNSGK